MAKSQAQIQQEYNEALKVSQSLTGALNKMIDDTEKSQKKVSDAQKKYNDNLKNIISSATDLESTEESILALEKQKEGLSKKYFGANAKILPQKQKELQGSIDILKSESKRLQLVGQVDEASQNLANSLSGSIDDFMDSIKSVPVLGKLLHGIGKGPAESLKKSLISSAKIFTTSFSNATASGKSGFQALGIAARQTGGTLLRALIGPQAILLAVVAVIGAGVLAFYKLEQAAKAFRNETGLLNSQIQQTEQNINQVYQSTVGLGASMEDVAQTAASFTNEFGGIEQPAENTIKSMVVLNKNFGVAIQDSAKVNKIFQNMAGVSEEVAQRQSEIVVELSRQAGVAPRQVMADIAESADEAGGFFRGNTKEMIRQSVAARAMGSSLKEVANVSKQLLDYQSSIESEMEASAILGTNLNFSQARYMAATGDIVGAQQNMVKQLRNRVDLENASVFEREAIAKATGMEFNQLLNLSRIQERFGDLKTEQMAAAQSLLKQGKDLSKLTSDDLAAETERLALQEETQGRLESIGNRLGAIGAELLQAFLPIGDVLVSGIESAMPFIKQIGKMFKSVGTTVSDVFSDLKPTLKVVGNLVSGIAKLFVQSIGPAIKIAFMPLQFVFKTINNIVDLVTSLVNDGLSGFVSKAKEMGPLMAGIATTVGLIGTIWAASILPSVIATAVSLGTTIVGALIAAVPILFTFAASMVTSAIAAISTMSALTLGLGALAVAGGIAAAAVAMDSSIDSSTSKVESVNDAVISPSGDIVSTAPDDWLIATKTPQTLGQQVSMPNISMDGVINELKELKQAFMANKDVYIDNERITSRVSKTQEKLTTNKFGLMTT